MKLLFQILFFTWFNLSATPPFSKVAIPSDYSGTKFSLSDGSCGVIRYKASDVSSITIPKSPSNGGIVSDPMPFTGHGFTSGKNGLLGVPEWKSAYVIPKDGAELWEVFSDGSEFLRAKFSALDNKFIPVP